MVERGTHLAGDSYAPVFVGGTGRCGTHAVASLIGRSDLYGLAPAELRLHCCQSGLYPYTSGARGRRWLLDRLRTHWWRRGCEWDRDAIRGAHQIAPRGRYLAAVARLAAAPPDTDRLAVSRRFVGALLDPLAPAPGAWVEKSPTNCAAGGYLDEMFPGMRLIHVVRDGRDVACSFMRVPWAPNDFESALALWEENLIHAHKGTRKVPPARVHRLRLEDLVLHRRDRTYLALLDFLGIPDTADLRSFFNAEVTADRARVGRWRSDLPRSDHRAAEEAYDAAIDRLRALGVWPLSTDPPPIEPVRDDRPAVGSPSRALSTVDPWTAATA